MNRTLSPELLDELEPDDPAARHSRRDLRLIGAVMRNDRWLLRVVWELGRAGERRLELGAGDGRLAGASGSDALDLHPPPRGWSGSARWHRVDVMKFSGWADYPVVYANLFLHHLSDTALRQLGGQLRRHARVIIACEPLRARGFQSLFAALCPLIGANEVTRHDGHVSIGAGFRDDDLPRLLGVLVDGDWTCRVRHTWLGAYRFTAVRE